MTNSILRSVRFSFVTLLLGLTAFTVAESALGVGRAGTLAASEGLSACGTAEQPCTLPAMAVVVEPRPSVEHVAADRALADCGSRDEPCLLAPIVAEADREPARLASSERLPRMTVRAGS